MTRYEILALNPADKHKNQIELNMHATNGWRLVAVHSFGDTLYMYLEKGDA